jgi:hypothetical protein
MMTIIDRIKLLFIFLFLLNFYHSNAQDLKSAYMQVKWTSGFTYSGVVSLVSDEFINTYRPFIMVDWGVKTDTLFLINEMMVGSGILKKYEGTCTYPGPGTYQVTYVDSFRISGIHNIAQSDNEDIVLSSMLKITTFQGPNTAPTMNNAEILLSVQGNKALFDPQFQDAENDSLSFQLVSCFAGNYRLPSGVSINDHGAVSFSRDSLGLYAFSFVVTEWRKDGSLNYQNIGSSQSDFVMNITTDVFVEEKISAVIRIYPNPTTSSLHILDEQNDLSNSIVEISNSIGQTILQMPFSNSIDVSTLPEGCYFLTITTTQNQQLHSKFVKR